MDTMLDTSTMKRYRKAPQTLGAVKLSEVYPVGTHVSIRTLEGDIDTIIDDDAVLEPDFLDDRCGR